MKSSTAHPINASFRPSFESADNHMMSVAARIQERALQLISERAILDAAKADLEHTQAIAEKETEINLAMRRSWLSAMSNRTSAELDLFAVRDKAQECAFSTHQLEEETREIQDETAKLNSQWKDDIKNLYAAQYLSMELHRRSLGCSIEVRENRETRQKDQLRELEQTADSLNKEKESMIEESKTIRLEIKSLEAIRKAEDQEVSELAIKVREALAKVTNDGRP